MTSLAYPGGNPEPCGQPWFRPMPVPSAGIGTKPFDKAILISSISAWSWPGGNAAAAG